MKPLFKLQKFLFSFHASALFYFLLLSLFSLSFTFYPHSSWATLTIHGAGATFPYPIYSKWFSEYSKKNSQVQFNYQSIGSGGGIQQLIKKTIDFGASDVPMDPKEAEKSSHPILHVPTVLGAVSVIFNLDETKELKLTGEVLAKIFLGQITHWDDPLIKQLNPGPNFPHKNILVVHRSDGSGTTAVYTEFLSEVSTPWKKNVGPGKAVKWPVGIGGKGNEGVTGIVQQTKGSIGYVELAYALQNKISMASLQNKDGQFISPSLKSLSAAATKLEKADDSNDTMSIINAPGKEAYPLTAITYLLIPQGLHQGEKLKELKRFLVWALKDGQDMASSLHYAPLPKNLREKMIKKIEKL